eukprot:NODE_910_length_3112_cov_0.790242.p2 type:complete len:109 gc:universal NODE_910_length_3112_cov_0.790242:2697-2371(-)
MQIIPSLTHFSILSRYPLLPMRIKWASGNLFFSQLIHCNCGSINKHHLLLFVNMRAFSIDTGSLGNPSLFHLATSASFARNLIKSKLSDVWIFTDLRNAVYFCNNSSL